MIKTLRYAFVAALMMVAGAVNAQTTFNFKNMWENIEPAGKDKTILYLNKSEANFGVHTIGDVTLAVIAGENPSGAPTYLRTTYKPMMLLKQELVLLFLVVRRLMKYLMVLL